MGGGMGCGSRLAVVARWQPLRAVLAATGAVLVAVLVATPAGASIAAPRADTQTAVGEACDVLGQVTDPDGRPVPNLSVGLDLTGSQTITLRTDASGRYRFNDFARFGHQDFNPIGGLTGGRLYDAGKGQVRVVVRLRDPDGRFQFHLSPRSLKGETGSTALTLSEVRVATAWFTLTTAAECRQDFALGKASGYGEANPADAGRWRNLLAMYRSVRAGFEFARTALKYTPRGGDPLRIHPWCSQDDWIPGVACPKPPEP